ncbi:hypothetical protein DFH08DRAFT_823718 [Mycena albidolilacea]|uniref:Uncharacterized protein n=1 Tax=Mycena albidolilacea TaxID=1033008 RepID=A0AAD6Z5F5_9AGAR|nr:hypothetical protein DFH08DRAFT_823718 [Mycena albidolilacea]
MARSDDEWSSGNALPEKATGWSSASLTSFGWKPDVARTPATDLEVVPSTSEMHTSLYGPGCEPLEMQGVTHFIHGVERALAEGHELTGRRGDVKVQRLIDGAAFPAVEHEGDPADAPFKGILFETAQGKVVEDAERVDHQWNSGYGAREQSQKRRDGQCHFGGVNGYQVVVAQAEGRGSVPDCLQIMGLDGTGRHAVDGSAPVTSLTPGLVRTKPAYWMHCELSCIRFNSGLREIEQREKEGEILDGGDVDTGTGERIRIGSYTVPAEAGDTQGLAVEYGNCVGR